ncbi:MAG: Arm DNA-binding domain-containing protein [Janthinobacterium lividum]
MTSVGAWSFILNYRAAGRERRITIGSFPDWDVSAAREHAERRTARGGRDSIDHAPGAHDNLVNAVAGALPSTGPRTALRSR